MYIIVSHYIDRNEESHAHINGLPPLEIAFNGFTNGICVQFFAEKTLHVKRKGRVAGADGGEAVGVGEVTSPTMSRMAEGTSLQGDASSNKHVLYPVAAAPREEEKKGPCARICRDEPFEDARKQSLCIKQWALLYPTCIL